MADWTPLPRVDRARGAWSSWPRSVRWSAVALAIAGLLLGVLAIGSGLFEQPVPAQLVGNGLVAFTVEANDMNGPSDIYVVRPGTPERALIGSSNDRVREACPQFSPDGKRIAYLSGPVVGAIEGRDEVRIVNLAANGLAVDTPQVLAADLVEATCPEWSPGSQSVALTSGRLDLAGQLVPLARTLSVVRLDGSSKAIDVGDSVRGPRSFDWSPDGTEIAYVGESSIWIAPIDGSAPRRVYEADADVELEAPEWSPDGRRILVEAGRWSIMERLPSRIIQIDGSAAPVELSGFRAITWSPDGQRLAAVRSTTVGTLDWNQIVMMSPDGGDVRVIADKQWAIQGLTWSPDGSELLYVEGQGPSPGVFAVAAAGGAEPRFLLSRPSSLYMSSDPSWQAVPR
jgi:Tol biopolymer transport system component